MDKMEVLQGVIEENIEWFWSSDPILDHEVNMTKLWDSFKTWCVQNCMEIFHNLNESVIEEMIEENYSNWLNKQIF